MSFILVAEDDPAIREGLVVTLESDGHEVRAARDGAEALALYAERRPDLLLLDIMMPKRSGYEVCAEIRRSDASLPILFLTAKAGEEDAVLGLGLGADDYIVKPFGVRELLARVAAALRRAAVASAGAAPPDSGADTFSIGTRRVDPRRFTLRAPDGAEESLTERELGLLRLFAAHPGEVLTRDRLLDDLWGVRYLGTTRTLDQHIAQLRRKLGSDAVRIETVHGVGYRYRAQGRFQ
jgi:DNA-binding response OmpR family regulator